MTVALFMRNLLGRGLLGEAGVQKFGERAARVRRREHARELVAARVDPVLFGLSYDYVGDLAETVSLIWPKRPGANRAPALDDVVETLLQAGRGE